LGIWLGAPGHDPAAHWPCKSTGFRGANQSYHEESRVVLAPPSTLPHRHGCAASNPDQLWDHGTKSGLGTPCGRRAWSSRFHLPSVPRNQGHPTRRLGLIPTNLFPPLLPCPHIRQHHVRSRRRPVVYALSLRPYVAKYLWRTK
jgi:hypothetical protein